ncbi:uncharacterized protein N7479_010314 [Penicillium vulpinum]|uniref:Uncharacterized protein n=1 Tax=Penicillium vulpinum TaxID=29845 RepID=A0A1V6S7X1_9EURO|nr:uncharacterized protein N7479_010314 [Penicillium vulpinum]KAJ5951901.1 hypothetical protein N7479_010314 [Penicillium vulpinum]OQE10162.1 hypothetical protein PENVUL_c004G09008 [Penicillium vulpinum]
MHISYISLAFFAIGAIAAPAAPKPGMGDITSGFPFNPTGYSSVEDGEEGFGDSLASALDAMEKAEVAKQSAKMSAHIAAQPTASSTAAPSAHQIEPTSASAVSIPTPVVSQVPTTSHAVPVASQAPTVSKAAPTTAVPTPTRAVIPTPSKSGSAKSGSASPSSSAAHPPSATASGGALGSLVKDIPVVGGLVSGPMAGLGLRH